MLGLKFNNGRVEDYTIVLSTKDYRHLGQLTGIKNVVSSGNMNAADEISFTIVKHDFVNTGINTLENKDINQKVKLEIWEQIVDFKLIWIKELDEYFEIKVDLTDSNDTFKTITAKSLCEAELSQINIYNTEINTEADIERDDYIVTTFYNELNPKASLLDRILSFAQHYHIKHVDDTLKDIQRSFSLNNVDIYSYLTGECSEQINCLFVFDSTDRTISAYDLLSNCNDCGNRGDFIDECPKCHSKNINGYGEDTTIFVDKNNLTDSIQLSVNTDSIKNCFKLEAGDELMTATVKMLNQNGSDYIISVTENQRKDMPQELIDKLDLYDEIYDSYTEEYEHLVEDIYQLTDDILYLESGMMPTIDQAEITAQTEVKKLTSENLNPLGLSSVTKTTSVATVNSALKNYAKIFVKSGYVKLDIGSDATFTYSESPDSDGNNYGFWHGYFTVTNYSDEEDVAKSDYLDIKVYDNYEVFTRQKVLKTLSSEDEDGSVFDVLAIDDFDKFKSALSLYSKNRLQSYYDAIQASLDILIQMDEGSETSELYDALYKPYYEKLVACQDELDKRSSEISEKQNELDIKEARRLEIQNELNFENFLGEYYPIFCLYKREQSYSNSNYISDGLSNTELIRKAKQFLEVARNELKKATSNQYTLTSTLKNFLAIKEFSPIKKYFKLGNWIRFSVDGELYKLRLIGYSISFDTIQNIDVIFSEITKYKSVAYKRNEIIQSAQSMASTYSYVSKQAEKGNKAQENINSFISNGLDTGLIQIKNNVNEDIIWDKNGLLCRSYDDVTDTYDLKQFKITHNALAFTDNGWRTVRQAIGEHKYNLYDTENNKWLEQSGYGMTADFVTAGWVTGAIIVGGNIYSINYSNGKNNTPMSGSYINLTDGTFSFGAGNLVYNGKDLLISSESLIGSLNNVEVTIDTLHIKSENIEGYILDSQIDTISANKITGINNDVISEVSVDKIIGTLPLSQIEEITFDNIIGELSASRISGTNNNLISELPASKITGTVASSKIASTLNNKTITNSSFSGSDVTSDNATIDNLTVSSIKAKNSEGTFTGLTGSYVLGDKAVKFVNGIAVEIIEI